MTIYKSKQGKEKILRAYDSYLNKWPVEYKTLEVDTSFGSTFILNCGENGNPPVLLLHGSGSNSLMWMGDIEVLSRNYNVFLIDIIGEPGKSEESRPPLSDDSHGKWLKEVIMGLGFESVGVVGYSIGGWMALNLAVNFPETVDKLILFCTSGITEPKISFMFKGLSYMFLGKWGLRKINTLLTNNKDMDKDAEEFGFLVSKYFKWRMKIPIYSDDEIKRINMPVLFIGGDKDALLNNVRTKERFESLIDLKSEILHDEGHVISNISKHITGFM